MRERSSELPLNITWIYAGIFLASIWVGLYLFSSILSPFILGWGIAYLFRPLIQAVTARGFSSTYCALVLTLILYVLCILSVVLLLPSLKTLILALSKYLIIYREIVWNWAQPWIQKFSTHFQHSLNLKDSFDTFLNMLTRWSIQNLMDLLQNSWGVARVCVTLLTAPLIGFHLMRDWDSIQEKITTLIPVRYHLSLVKGFTEINQSLARYFRGQFAVCVVLSVYYAVGLSVLDLEFGLVVGVLTGIFSFIPYMGLVLGFLSAVLLSLFQFGTASCAIAIGILYILGQVLEGGVLTPWLVGKKIGLHPIIVLFAIFAGASLKGLVGIFWALPVATVLAACWRLGRQRYLHSSFYNANVP